MRTNAGSAVVPLNCFRILALMTLFAEVSACDVLFARCVEACRDPDLACRVYTEERLKLLRSVYALQSGLRVECVHIIL